MEQSSVEQVKKQLSTGAVLAAGAAALFSFNAAPASARTQRMQRYMDLIHRAEHRLDRDMALGKMVCGDVKHDIITTSVSKTKLYRTRVPFERRAAGRERYFRIFVQEGHPRSAILPLHRSRIVPGSVKEAPVFNPNPHNGGQPGLQPVTNGCGEVVVSTQGEARLSIPNVNGSEYQLLPAGQTELIADIGEPLTRQP